MPSSSSILNVENGDDNQKKHLSEKEAATALTKEEKNKRKKKKKKKEQGLDDARRIRKEIEEQGLDDARRIRKEIKKQKREQELAALTLEERKARSEERKERVAKMLAERERAKEELAKAMQVGQNIVLDLDFCDGINPLHGGKFRRQVVESYSANKKSSSPAHIWLTGCKGEIRSQLEKCHFDKWPIEKEERSYIEAFKDRKKDLVYLTAESETILQELESSKIYIIGGILDHEGKDGKTMQKAKSQGIETAKLPPVNDKRTTNYEVWSPSELIRVLIAYSELKDWKKAQLQVMPKKKKRTVHSRGTTNEGKTTSLLNDKREEETSDGACDPEGQSAMKRHRK